VDGSLTGFENLLIFAKLYDLPHHEQQARIADALEFMNSRHGGQTSEGNTSLRCPLTQLRASGIVLSLDVWCADALAVTRSDVICWS